MSLSKLIIFNFTLLIISINILASTPTIVVFCGWQQQKEDEIKAEMIKNFTRERGLAYKFIGDATIDKLEKVVDDEDIEIVALAWSSHGSSSGKLLDINGNGLPKDIFKKIPIKYHLMISACHPLNISEYYDFDNFHVMPWLSDTVVKVGASDFKQVILRFLNDVNSIKIQDITFVGPNTRFGCDYGSAFIFTNQNRWNQIKKKKSNRYEKIVGGGSKKWGFKGIPKKVDVAFYVPSKDNVNKGQTYIFSDNKYFVFEYDKGQNGICSGVQNGNIKDKFPDLIKEIEPEKIETAFHYKKKSKKGRAYIYFLSGGKSYQYDPDEKEGNRLRSIGNIESHWKGLKEAIAKYKKIDPIEINMKEIRINAAFSWPSLSSNRSNYVFFIIDGGSYQWRDDMIVSSESFEKDWGIMN